MASILFFIATSFLISVGVNALLLPVIIRGKFVSLPLFFFATQLVLATLTIPLVNLATVIWHLLPVYGILSILPLILSLLSVSFLRSTVSVIVTNAFRNLSAIFFPLLLRLNFFSPFDISEDIRESFDSLFASVEEFLTHGNFSEVFRNVQKQPQFDPTTAFSSFLGNFSQGFAQGGFTQGGFTQDGFSQLPSTFSNFPFNSFLKNLTISDETQQYVDAINVATIRLLETARVENVFNETRLPSDLSASVNKVMEALRLFGKDLNFTEILRDGIVPPTAQDHLNEVGSTLFATIAGADVKGLYNTSVLMPAQELNLNSEEGLQLMSFLNNPFQFVVSSSPNQTLNKGWLWGEIVSNFLASAWRSIGFIILLLFVIVPLVFVLRAAMQDGCLWLVTRRYRFMIPSEQRSASGWMFVAATSGLAFAFAEVFPLCCMFLFLQSSNENRDPWLFFSLVFHVLKGAPLRAASHMRLTEGIAEKDIMKERESGLTKGIIVSALINGIFSFWWASSSVAFLLYAMFPNTGPLLVVTVLTDIFLIGCSIGWGRRISWRTLEKERRWKEAQDRKRD